MIFTSSTIDTIAMLAHEANRLIQAAGGEEPSPPWADAPAWQQASAREGVVNVLENPGMTPEQSHIGWLGHKAKNGWRWGPVKDAEKKEHPCFLPYHKLPAGQRVKDEVFTGVVRTVLDGLEAFNDGSPHVVAEPPAAEPADPAAAFDVEAAKAALRRLKRPSPRHPELVIVMATGGPGASMDDPMKPANKDDFPAEVVAEVEGRCKAPIRDRLHRARGAGMIRLTDGPAAGVQLHLNRTPILLRVVEGPGGKFDALDQLDDVPADDEKIYVYRITAPPGVAFLDYHDKAGRRCGKRLLTATYAALPDQPEDAQVRTTAAWQAWCEAWAKAEGIKT